MWKHYERNTFILLYLKLMHFAVSVVLFYLAWLLFRYGSLLNLNRYGFRYNFFVTIGYGLLIYWFNRVYNAYLLGYSRIRSLVFAQFLAQLFSVVIVYFVVSIGWNRFLAPWLFIPLLAVQIILDIVWSLLISKLYFKLNPRRKTLLVYRNALDRMRFGSIKGKPTERLYEITDELQYDGSFTDLEESLKGYDSIFVAGVNSRCRNGILKYCKENHVPGFFLPHVGDLIMQEAMHVQSFDSPVLYVNRKVLNPEYAVCKRLFDIASSGLALILLSPIMLITGLAIHFYDGGPALYRQTRLTKDGKEFKILKFRSMRVDAEKDGVARLSTGDKDDRITPIGRVIRKLRLDELPQLWNIFVGDMSVVGPRPERPEIAAAYCEVMPDFQLRLQVKAGLTGYAQVYGKYNTEPYEKLEFDLLYINHMSLLTDLQLCFATVAILFSSESTSGVEEGAVTAMDYDAVPCSDHKDREQQKEEVKV
jgi:exopolysaccharide biosynthesis polyprenyl glycosylphosphotransferase